MSFGLEFLKMRKLLNILTNFKVFPIRTFKTKGKGQKDVTIEKIRNVGVMAHIDAGKTTTTERMLFYSGEIATPGEVHHGDTVTDFLPQERERGITIQSAIVTFPWADSTINLIDTPGHVDFTFEVERSLRVVDSAIAILDASAGVEAQTLTVWRQANNYNLPRIIFLNKMDKAKASIQMCLDSIQTRLEKPTIQLQLPVYNKSMATKTASGLVGIIDLVSMKRFIFNQATRGAKYSIENIESGDELRKRCELVEQVADLDSKLADQIIEEESIENITEEALGSAIRRVTLRSDAFPLLLGSSYKNIGVQHLLNSILRYLPNPLEVKKKERVIAFGNDPYLFSFKTIHDPMMGSLTFLRNFSGCFSGNKIYNITRRKGEKVGKIFKPFADDLLEIEEIREGEIAVIPGLKETFTGDTLTSSSSAGNSVLKKLGENGVLTGLTIPDPVFFCSVEPASLLHQKGLDSALECMQREDPSLKSKVDEQTGQTILSGMGELHLEVIKERLKTEYKVDAYLGKIQVAYKETMTETINKRILFERRFSDRNQSVKIELEISKNTDEISTEWLTIKKGSGKEAIEHLASLSERHLRLIETGVNSSLRCGPKLGFPVTGIDVKLNYFELGRGTSDTIIEAAAASCTRQTLQEGNVLILEPIATLNIVVDSNYQQAVLDDLNRRRFELQYIDTRHGDKIISGIAPLSELMGYSTIIRTVSSGMGSFSLQFNHNRPVISSFDEEKIIKEVRGF